jgi:hypothetical protein
MQDFFMFRKHRLFTLIPALLLIPILLGMIPLNMAHKLAQGGTFAQASQSCACKNCPALSRISHNHFDAAMVDAASSAQGSTHCHKALSAMPQALHSNIHAVSIPLRC